MQNGLFFVAIQPKQHHRMGFSLVPFGLFCSLNCIVLKIKELQFLHRKVTV